MIADLKRFLVLTGNYGSGKTEIALNLALQQVRQESVTLVDLDIVNPYFRSGEKAQELCDAGVRVLMPTFALTTVDIPALPAEIQSVFEIPCDRVIFDVGGDDTGAAALGRYAPSFAQHAQETTVAMVINCMRPLTQTVDDITDLAVRIANRSRLQPQVLINNTNLADRTNAEMLAWGHELVSEAAQRLKIATVLDAGLPGLVKADTGIQIRRMMKPEWMDEL